MIPSLTIKVASRRNTKKICKFFFLNHLAFTITARIHLEASLTTQSKRKKRKAERMAAWSRTPLTAKRTRKTRNAMSGEEPTSTTSANSRRISLQAASSVITQRPTATAVDTATTIRITVGQATSIRATTRKIKANTGSSSSTTRPSSHSKRHTSLRTTFEVYVKKRLL